MDSSLVGQTLGGRYRVEEKIGEGGMSAVYRAFDPNLQRVVAIKVIKTSLAADQKFLGRFEAEATAVAQLRHSNIVQVFDYNHDGDLYYMVQEFVPGETLQERLKRLHNAGRELSVADAVHYAINICDAAGYAHRRGLIHRDIKPSNIMLDVHGDAILMDFGIVKILGGVEHTVAGAVVGTALYMPPELIRGEVPDPRSDIYSLGVALFEMLSGHPPFEADSAMTLLMMHLHDPVPDLHSMRPEVPQELCEIVEKSLAKDRSERYGSMSELAAALGRVLSQQRTGVGVADQPTSLEGQTVSDMPTEERLAGLGPVATGKTVLESPSPRNGRPPAGTLSRAATPAATARSVAAPAQKPGAAEPASAPAQVAAEAPARPRRGVPKYWPLWLGAAVVLLALIVGGVLLLTRNKSGDKGLAGGAPSALPEAGGHVAHTAEVSPTPSVAHAMATPTPPAGRITIGSITLDSQQRYVVNFQASGFTQPITNTGVHFFFNTVAPADAGTPGHGPWLASSGSSPFTGYGAADRPEGASQICVLAAGPGDGVVLGTGNCAVLPDIVATTPVNQDVSCYFGPGDTYPVIAALRMGQSALVRGLSNDELWWQVTNPEARPDPCWVSTVATKVSGDVSSLPLVDAPPPGATPQTPVVTITQIISDSGQYVVSFTLHGFTPHYPGGTHLHFFFNTFTPDQVGIGGDANRRSWGNPPPFTTYAVRDRPAGATQMCVVIANPNHSVIPNTESCMNLPGLPHAEINKISLDKDKHYVVDFTIRGFTPKYPGGTHMHFYFNTFTPDQVGIGGEANRRSWGEAPPFTTYTAADRPEGATEMCVVVANPDHSVMLNTGNCFKLPDVPGQ